MLSPSFSKRLTSSGYPLSLVSLIYSSSRDFNKRHWSFAILTILA